jgi:hypothetical protein
MNQEELQESLLGVEYDLPQLDNDLVEYIKGFVHDKNGLCLKEDIIQALFYTWKGVCEKWCPVTFKNRGGGGGNYVISKWLGNLHEKMDLLENSGIYNGTGLSIETSGMTGRTIYRYVDPVLDFGPHTLIKKFKCD